MAQRKVNDSEDLRHHADDDEMEAERRGPARQVRSKTDQRHGDTGGRGQKSGLSSTLTCSPHGCGPTAACRLDSTH